MEKFFKLKDNGTKVSTEVIAGLTTFFAMAYIFFVNPNMLSQTGMPFNAVFLATIFSAVAGTLVMGLFANVPYVQAPGMGLNAFFTYTVCFSLGYSWQQALAMVFICGIINVLITVTKFRKVLIKAIPVSLQNAIGGGIGVFIAYIGIQNAGLIRFGAVPELVEFNTAPLIMAVIAIIIMVVLVVLNVKGGIFISIAVVTLITMGVTFLRPELGLNPGFADFLAGKAGLTNLGDAFKDLGTTFGAAFGKEGMQSLFSEPAKIPLVLMTIFTFSLSDTFDTIGTFIGTGRRTGIFDEEDQRALEEGTGFKSKMDKALFADSVATSIGAVLGTSNTTTFVESAAGIGAGGRTGLTSVVAAALMLVSILVAPIVGWVPSIATAPALIIVGVMMLSAFADIKWTDLEEAVPAFFASIFMGLCYSISYGIAAGFIFYCVVKLVKGKFKKDVHPVLLVSTLLFILNFAMLAYLMMKKG